MIKKAFILVFLSLNLCLVKAHADIYTPAQLNMSTEELNQLLNTSFKEGLVLNNELKDLPKISGLKFDAENIKYSATFTPNFDIQRDGQVRLHISVKDIELRITNFDAQYKLVQNQGSLRVNVFTQMTCDSLAIRSVRDVQVEAYGSIQHNQPWVGDIEFLEQPAFEIISENCIAPGNYQEKLSEIAVQWLTSDEGRDQLIELVNKDVIAEYWESFRKGLEFNFLGRKIYIALVNLDVIDEISVQVQIRWPDREQIALNTQFPQSRNVFSYTISDLRKVLQSWVPKECFSLDYTREEIPGANDLFESRFMQFFAWRDLMNFPKEVDFKLYVKICVNKLTINHALENGIKFNHNSVILVQLNLIQNKQELPYVVAYGAGTGELSVLSDGNGMGLKLERTKFDMQSRFHSKMSSWRGVKNFSGAPSMSMIFPRVVTALEGKPISVADEFSVLLRNLKFSSGEGYLHLHK